ncbi:MAG: hypothetical protein PWP27_752 [Clostridiales bacterium]|jgi:hypothetical protein|nr:hypothetical protein [Clostridiales bacterium]MDK2932942.1 hypothetical protein [Clostridiales bacterium]
MMFDIKIVQIADVEEFDKVLKGSDKLIVCAARWGPMCIPVYKSKVYLQQATVPAALSRLQLLLDRGPLQVEV